MIIFILPEFIIFLVPPAIARYGTTPPLARASFSFLTPYSHLLFPTNLNIINYYSTFAKNNENLNDYWITGFVDGEGSFMVMFVEDQRRKTGWRVYLCFAISLHKKDEVILRKIKKSLGGVGTITSKGHSGVHLRVTDLKGIDKLIKHFDKFPLITQKRADAELFKKVYQFMENKEHLTREGLRKIVALKDQSNHGLSDKLKKAFPDFVPVSRPIVMNQIIEDPNWLTGFTTAEGCYYIDIYRSKSNKLGFVVRLVFSIGQHKRDEALLISFIYYLNCGTVNKNKDICVFRVTKFDDIVNKIIPLFNNNLILGVKAEDFNDFCKVAEMMKKKEHLGTPRGGGGTGRLRLSFPLSEYLFSPFRCRSRSPFLDRGKGKERNSERGKDRQRKGEKEVFRRRAVPRGGPPPFEL